MVYIGGLIVLLTFYAIIKRYETRMVLFVAGLAMAILAGKPVAAIDAFAARMVSSGLVTVILTVMGFAYVMKLTKCDAHLVKMMTGVLSKVRVILIPGTVLITAAINVALPSAAGCSAAVGAIMIPTLIGAGVHPAAAASAVLAGTWGSVLSPGGTHNAFMAKMVNTDVLTAIATHVNATFVGIIVVAIGVTAMSIWKKEDKGYVAEADKAVTEELKVNYLKAIVPLIPLILLVLGSKQVGVIPYVSVPLAMISGTIIAFFVTFTNPQEISKQFFAGMGDAYGNVMGIIIAAAVFTTGMKLIGLTGALINAMKASSGIAKIAATFGPFIIAVLSGSGDAATLAFNGAITPHAQQFGYGILQMGSMAQLSGSLGRSMSPVAGAAIVCAGLAGVNTMELTKRNWPVMVVAVLVVMFILL